MFMKMAIRRASDVATSMPDTHGFQIPVGAWISAKV